MTQSTTQQKQALVIEDDFDASIIFSRALEANGYETQAIFDGQKARTRLEGDEVPDIILLDMHLPNVPGKTLLKEIRADERFAEARLIVVTADSGIADMIRDQADLVLLKPTTYTQVRDFTSRLLRRMDRSG
jgi:DNA-binding response OmpR family regulator